jgi:acyl phosphate:glycerol-3-phosphate acyltransferase
MRPLRLLSAAAVGYLLGTVPSADLAARLAGRGDVDLRRSGSRNPGGVNAMRLLGATAGRAVTVADVAKGFAACACGRSLAGDTGAHVGGVAAVVGHCYPLWTGFRGGKGVATSFGQCLYTFPAAAPLDLAVAIGVARMRGLRRPALVSTAASSTVWLVASLVWWRRRLPNSWGPPPTVALPLANAATALVVATRFARAVRLGHPDDLELPQAPLRRRQSRHLRSWAAPSSLRR